MKIKLGDLYGNPKRQKKVRRFVFRMDGGVEIEMVEDVNGKWYPTDLIQSWSWYSVEPGQLEVGWSDLLPFEV